MERLWQNLRYTIRVLGKNPGFTAVAILSLALGIGANTAIFTLINALLLRDLPVRHPEQLAMLRHPPGEQDSTLLSHVSRTRTRPARLQEDCSRGTAAQCPLCAARPCRLVQAEVVRDELEEKLLLHAERVTSLETDELIAHYRRLVELTDPDAAGIRRFLAEAMGRLTREGPGRRRGQEKQDAGLRLPAQL